MCIRPGALFFSEVMSLFFLEGLGIANTNLTYITKVITFITDLAFAVIFFSEALTTN
jgi:hypothetical protein